MAAMVHPVRDKDMRHSASPARGETKPRGVASRSTRTRRVGTNDPYASLDPGAGSDPPPEPLVREAGWFRVLVRGARKRCPRCGFRPIFDGWFRLKTRCPRCDLRFEAEEGGFLGAMTVNYAAAIGAWIAVMAVGLAMTVPDVPVTPLLIASAGVLVAMPLWFYPRSKTIWAAVEFLVARSDPDYRTPTRRDPRAHDLE
jgi:uncharacterized protein (DUF983 family)